MLGIHVLKSCWEFPFLYGITINLSFSKLCRKDPIRSVVGWYKMSFFLVLIELVLVWKEISGENSQIRSFLGSARHPYA